MEDEIEFEVQIETNQIVFDLKCDPCAFEDGGLSCKCRENCIDENYEYCYSGCDSEFGYSDIAWCKIDCSDDFGYNDWNDYRSCFGDCGNYPRLRNIQRYVFAFNFWWTHGLVETQIGAPDEQFISPIFNESIKTIIHNTNQDFMNESISYCYQYQIIVEYDDGTCCDFRGAACYQQG